MKNILKKKSIVLLVSITFACKSPIGDTDHSHNDYWSKFENWAKGQEVDLKIENIVGVWVRKDTTEDIGIVKKKCPGLGKAPDPIIGYNNLLIQPV